MAQCDFVKIYKNDENNTEFINKNIIDYLINTFILNKDIFQEEKN